MIFWSHLERWINVLFRYFTIMFLEYEESCRARTTTGIYNACCWAMFDYWRGTEWMEVVDFTRLPETIQSKHPMHL